MLPRAFKQAAASDWFAQFPTHPGLYAADFGTGLIKVGRAQNIQHRLRQHDRMAALRFRGKVRRAHAAPCWLVEVAERALLARMDRIANRHRGTKEFYSGVTFTQARQVCDQTVRAHHYKHGRRFYDMRPDLWPSVHPLTLPLDWEVLRVMGLLSGSDI